MDKLPLTADVFYGQLLRFSSNLIVEYFSKTGLLKCGTELITKQLKYYIKINSKHFQCKAVIFF